MSQQRNNIQLALNEIFRLAKDSPDLETMMWYVSLAECFENREVGDISNASWRLSVLSQKGQPVEYLGQLLADVVGKNIIRPLESFC